MTKDNNNMTDKQLDSIAAKIVARMVKLKSMEDWFSHVNKSEESWVVYEDLDLDEEAAAYGELAKLMTLMDICKQDEAYEKCAIIKNRIDETKAIIRKYKK
jgi:C4-type Zn-finger protein